MLETSVLYWHNDFPESNEMINEVELKRLYWHSRRGMLELDLLLIPFVEKQLSKLNRQDQILYKELLEEEDQDLFTWLIGKEVAPNPQLQKIIDLILSLH